MKRRTQAVLLVLSSLLASGTHGDEAPLPSIETVLQHLRVMANQEQGNEGLFRFRYAFVQTRATRELDAKGRVKKQSTKETRNTPAFVATAYNIPLSSRSSAAPDSASQNSQPRQEAEAKPFEENDFVLNDDLLSRFEMTVLRREQLNGRNTLLIEFKPARKKLPSHSLKDRFINKTAGEVWIDEGDWMFSQIDLHLIDSVNVVGGLVSAVKKFNYRCERQRTPDALWDSANIAWHLEGREHFSRKTLEYQERRTDIKKVR